MKEFKCTKCNSEDLFIEKSGNNTGLYCSDCGKWITWLNKDEMRLAERWIAAYKAHKNDVYNNAYHCICLLNSMVLCGENHSEDSEKLVKITLDQLLKVKK